MFKQNKYTKWYYQIIDNSKDRPKSNNEYYEDHHIIPKSLGGSNESSNIATLTAREHYIVHLLLMKMCKNKQHQFKMSTAFVYMREVRNDHTTLRYNSRLYEYHKKLRSSILKERMSGNKNPMYGRKHTDETKRKISEKRRSGKWDPNTIESKERKRKKWIENNPMNDPENIKKITEKTSKTYKVTNPQGKSFIIKGLSKFCKENGLNTGNMSSVANGKLNHYKGWKCEYYKDEIVGSF